jgi:ankyrin repeat protein
MMNKIITVIGLNALLIATSAFAMDIDLENKLCEAAFAGNNRQVKALLDAGASVNEQDYRGWTALNRAARSGYKYICLLLLNHNAQVDIKNNSGWTPLMNAAYHGHNEICALLLDCNAQTNTKNNNGWTPLMLAATRRHKSICRLLINSMLKPIKQKTNSIIALLGCNRKRRANLLSLLPRDIAKIIAHQLHKSVIQEKQSLFEEISASKNEYMRAYLYVYAWQKLKDHSKTNEKKSLEPDQKRSRTDDDE